MAGHKLRREVSSGFSYYDADTVSWALVWNGGLSKTVVVVFTPVRSDDKLAYTSTLPAYQGLDTFHHTVLEQDAGGAVTGLRCFKFSGYGVGALHPLAQLLRGTWAPGSANPPPLPDFLCRLVGADVLADAPSARAAGGGRFQERKAAAMTARKEVARDVVSARFVAQLAAQQAAGLFPCGEKCYVFATERGLRKHQAKASGPTRAVDTSSAHQATYGGRGKSGGLGSIGALVEMAARPGEGMLSANSHANRSSAAPPPTLQVMHTLPLVSTSLIAS